MASPLSFEEVAIRDLQPSPRNARTHSAKQIQQIADSIQTFGFVNPLLIDESSSLIAGHGRLEAAKNLKLLSVPAIRITHLSDAEKRALMLADNKIALGAGWNMELLASELAELSEMDLDFSLDATGFEVPEIDLILGEASDQEVEDEVPLPDPTTSVIARPGDIWNLGRHRIVCGDALAEKTFDCLLEGRKASVGFTDPPYNVKINGHVSGKGKVRHREFLQASGEMSETEFRGFLVTAFGHAARHSELGAVWFACIDWRHMADMQSAGIDTFGDWLNLCVWTKTNGGMGSLYRSQHELVFVFRNGRLSHRNNVQLGKHGRNRTNVWCYPGVNTFRRGRMDELAAHPTAKPVAMVKDALLDVSKRGDIVLDPFAGAGATLIAAEKCGRTAYCIELDPAYVDVVLRRWRTECGEEPQRAVDNRSFTSLEEEMSDE